MKDKLLISVMLCITVLFIAPVFAEGTFKPAGPLYQVLSGYSAQQPQKNCLYDLSGMVVLQSADNGVLIEINPNMYGTYLPYSSNGVGTVFLYTNEKYVDGVSLSEYWAYYVGTYQYFTVLGAQKTVYAFKMYDKSKGDALTQKIREEQEAYVAEQNRQIQERKKAEQEQELERQRIEQEQKEKDKKEMARYNIYFDIGQPSITQPGTQSAISYGVGFGYDADNWFGMFGTSYKKADYSYIELYGKAGIRVVSNVFIEGGVGVQNQYALDTTNSPNALASNMTYMGGIKLKYDRFSIYADYHNYRMGIIGIALFGF